MLSRTPCVRNRSSNTSQTSLMSVNLPTTILMKIVRKKLPTPPNPPQPKSPARPENPPQLLLQAAHPAKQRH